MVEGLASGQRGEQLPGCQFGRRRILAGDQRAIDHGVRLPIGALAVVTAVGLEHVLNQEWHHVRELNGLFLGIRKTSNAPAANQGRAISLLGMP